MIKNNLSNVIDQISSSCQKIGRNPNEITLVGVTKYVDASAIVDAVNCGLSHIGENRVQDAKSKFSQLPNSCDVVKHMIGHLQTNKAKDAVEVFDVIQSVDRLKLINEIQKQALNLNKKVDVFLQVNTAGEDQKYGANPEDVNQLVEGVLASSQLNLTGFMAMAPFTNDESVIHKCFADLRNIFDDVNQKYAEGSLKYLSMGMSNDYHIALKEGANMLRIGSAIFKS